MAEIEIEIRTNQMPITSTNEEPPKYEINMHVEGEYDKVMSFNELLKKLVANL